MTVSMEKTDVVGITGAVWGASYICFVGPGGSNWLCH